MAHFDEKKLEDQLDATAAGRPRHSDPKRESDVFEERPEDDFHYKTLSWQVRKLSAFASWQHTHFNPPVSSSAC
jgi:hypothetical protein